MSYGFEVINADGAVVIDSEFPSVFLDNETTITGAKVFADYDVYRFTLTQTGYAPFFNVPVGEWVSYSGAYSAQPLFYGSQETFTIRKAIFLSETTYTPDGYGMEIYDASGDALFSSSESLIPVRGFTNDLSGSPSQGQFSTSVEWVSPISSDYVWVPGDTSSQTVLMNSCVRRLNSSTFDMVQRPVAASFSGPSPGSSGGSSLGAIFAG